MTVVVIKDVKAPLRVFDATCQILGIQSGGPGYSGALFELAHATDIGIRCVSLYPTHELAEANVAAVEQAAAQLLAAQGVPSEAIEEAVKAAMAITHVDAHAWFTANTEDVLAASAS